MSEQVLQEREWRLLGIVQWGADAVTSPFSYNQNDIAPTEGDTEFDGSPYSEIMVQGHVVCGSGSASLTKIGIFNQCVNSLDTSPLMSTTMADSSTGDVSQSLIAPAPNLFRLRASMLNSTNHALVIAEVMGKM